MAFVVQQMLLVGVLLLRLQPCGRVHPLGLLDALPTTVLLRQLPLLAAPPPAPPRTAAAGGAAAGGAAAGAAAWPRSWHRCLIVVFHDGVRLLVEVAPP